MLMMRMTETQRVWGCQCAETALPRPGSQEKRGPGFLLSEVGKAWFCVSLHFAERDLSECEVQAASEWGAVRQVAKRETGASGRGAALGGEEDR